MSLSATATHLGFVGKVSPTGLPLAVGTSHLFDRNDAGEGPQVGVRDPRVLLLDRFEEPARVFEAGAGGKEFLCESLHPPAFQDSGLRLAAERVWRAGRSGRFGSSRTHFAGSPPSASYL